MCKAFGNLFAHLQFGNILLVCSCHVVGAIKINGPYDMATFVVTNGWISAKGETSLMHGLFAAIPPAAPVVGHRSEANPWNPKRWAKRKLLCLGALPLRCPLRTGVGGIFFSLLLHSVFSLLWGKSRWSYLWQPDCGFPGPVLVQSLTQAGGGGHRARVEGAFVPRSPIQLSQGALPLGL